MSLPPPPDSDVVGRVADGLASTRVIAELAAGYRAACLEQGFTPEAAEQMAVDLHRQLLAKSFDRRDDA